MNTHYSRKITINTLMINSCSFKHHTCQAAVITIIYDDDRASLVVQLAKNLPVMQKTSV